MFSQLKKLAPYSVLILCSHWLVACASQPEPVATSHDKELEAELAEWKKLKPGVERLVAIESELKGLLTALEGIAANEPTAGLETVNDGQNVQTQTIEQVVFEEKKINQPPSVLARAEQQNEPVADNKLAAEIPKTTTSSDLYSQHTTVEPQLAATQGKEEAIEQQKQTTEAKGDASKIFSLQLASVTQEQAVDQTWDRLKKRYPNVLGSLDLHSEQVLVANKTYYRVKAGRFDSYDEAKQSCKLLLNSGASCIVNKG